MAQLVSALVLVVIQALVRRHVGDSPDDFIPLEPGYEATKMVRIIYRLEQWEICTDTCGFRKEITSNPNFSSVNGSPITAPASQPQGTSSLIPELLLRILKVSDSVSSGYASGELAEAVMASQERFLEIQPCKTEVHDMAV